MRITSSMERIRDYTERGWWGSITLHHSLEQQARDNPDLLAVADQPNRQQLTGDKPRRLSFGALQRASDHLAVQLLDAGVKSGDAIIVQLPNLAELVVTYLAISKIGAIISPVPVQYGAHELQHIATLLNPVAMLTIERFREQMLAEQAAACLGGAVKLLVFNDRIAIDTRHCESVVERLGAYCAAHPVSANHILTVCWTSGTTGTPKGVPRSHNMWMATAQACVQAAAYRPGDRFLNIFPLVNMASVGGFLFPAMLVGCSIILHHPIEPALYLSQLQDEKVTFTLAPPALLNQLAKSPQMWNQFDFSALRSVGSGSAPLAPWMIEIFREEYGIEVLNLFGSNEGITLFCTPEDTSDAITRATMFPRGVAKDRPASHFVRSKVVDMDSGEEITEVGRVGELLFDGATVFDGYLGSDNSEVFTDEGYFRTGDLVEICGDPASFYRIAGRCKDIINRGGIKISPSEIDVLLEGLPGASEAAVCSYSDERLGEKVCACVVASVDSADSLPTLQQIGEYLGQKGIAKFKLPERLEFFQILPRNPLGKVQRFRLHDWVAERLEEDK